MLPVAKKAASGHDYYDYESTGMVVPRYEIEHQRLALGNPFRLNSILALRLEKRKFSLAIETGYLRIFALL